MSPSLPASVCLDYRLLHKGVDKKSNFINFEIMALDCDQLALVFTF